MTSRRASHLRDLIWDLFCDHVSAFVEMLSTCVSPRLDRRELTRQCAQVGWNSLPVTLAAGLFTGAVLALQFHAQLSFFGAEKALGGLSTSGTLRLVGPVLVAFMLAGKVGAFTAAELASLKTGQQIEALTLLGVSARDSLVAPRFWAVALTSVVLLAFGMVIAILGGLLAAIWGGGMNAGQYLSSLPMFATGEGFAMMATKSVVFGFLMAHFCCFNGVAAEGGAEAVGLAVRKTAVQSMVAIVLADLFTTFVVSRLSEMGTFS